MNVKKVMAIALGVWTISLVYSGSAHAQVSLGASVGGASGSVAGAVADVRARARISPLLAVTVGNSWMAGPWGCAQRWPESYRCSFDGSTLYAAPAWTVVRSAELAGTVELMAGMFSELGAFPGRESTFAWGAGAGGEASLSRRWGAEIRLQHWRIRDELFEELFGRSVYVTSVLFGVNVVVF